MARFHTGTGEFVGWDKLPNCIKSFNQAILRKLFNFIPREPWIPFSVTKEIIKYIESDWFVWEIGSGFSTLWFADRVRKITSIEASDKWYKLILKRIEIEELKNVDLQYEWHGDRMANFSKLGDEKLDFLFIDGGPRDQCLINGFDKVKSRGFIYLDNWDTKEFWGNSEKFLMNKSNEIEFIKEYIDYVPAQVGVYKGLFIRKK